MVELDTSVPNPQTSNISHGLPQCVEMSLHFLWVVGSDRKNEDGVLESLPTVLCILTKTINRRIQKLAIYRYMNDSMHM